MNLHFALDQNAVTQIGRGESGHAARGGKLIILDQEVAHVREHHVCQAHLLLRVAVHLQRQDHWEFGGDESIFGDGSRHIVKHCHGAESVAMCHVRVSSASPVPAVDFHMPASLNQLTAVHVGAAETGELVADDIGVMRASRPEVRQRLVQDFCIRGGRHSVVLWAQQLESKVLHTERGNICVHVVRSCRAERVSSAIQLRVGIMLWECKATPRHAFCRRELLRRGELLRRDKVDPMVLVHSAVNSMLLHELLNHVR
mmetsp:Transcript_10775/g.28268  ORF Transcript_10775/g.28268 Transcript_10775/m.28268 type:complete len:257 (-) Transcript_10775:269-1039(-)